MYQFTLGGCFSPLLSVPELDVRDPALERTYKPVVVMRNLANRVLVTDAYTVVKYLQLLFAQADVVA